MNGVAAFSQAVAEPPVRNNTRMQMWNCVLKERTSVVNLSVYFSGDKSISPKSRMFLKTVNAIASLHPIGIAATSDIIALTVYGDPIIGGAAMEFLLIVNRPF